MQFFKGLFAGLGIGVGAALALYAAAFILEALNCITCGCITCQAITGWEACDNSINLYYCGDANGMFPMWSGKIFLNILIFCGIAGTAIGTVYGIATSDEPGKVIAAIFFPVTGPIYGVYCLASYSSEQKKKRKNSIDSASGAVKRVKVRSDILVPIIQNAEKTIVSVNAKKILECAAAEANKSALALETMFKIANNAYGKSSKTTLKNAQQAENTSRLLEKSIDAANDLYYKAMKEETDWNRLQQEANDSVTKANNAAENAEKKAGKIEKMTFNSVFAKDAAEKAAYALTKVKEAAAETVKRADAAARAASAQDAQIEVKQADFSMKRALVEEKIVVEETNIAMKAH